MKIRNGFFALSLFILAAAVAASAQTTRTYSLVNGGALTPASPSVGLNGVTTYYGGYVHGGVESTSPATFTVAVTFSETGISDPATGIHTGTIVGLSNTFAVTQSSGRKSVTTSGSINSGTVYYRLTEDGRAEIVGIQSTDLTIWEGKNKRRTAVGNGSIDYGTTTEGSGTLTLNFS